jgi:uncharacterized protein (TIGR03118 family)
MHGARNQESSPSQGPDVSRERHGPIVALTLLLAACGGGGGSDSGDGGGKTPTVNISISPTSISVGQSATLSWSSTNADLCEGRNAWTGDESFNGSQTITPVGPGSFTYTLVCSNFSGNDEQATESVTLTVTGGTAYQVKRLVSDTAAGGGTTVDAHLVNAWGVAAGPTTPVWVSNNHDQSATSYDGTGTPYPTAGAPAVSFPASATGAPFSPTGVVFNTTTGFNISSGGTSAPAQFIFVGGNGSIAGWSSSVDPNRAVVAYSDSQGAVYTSVTLTSGPNGNRLYATDFHNGKVDVFDGNFNKQVPGPVDFSFKDFTLSADYGPFAILALNNGPGGAYQIYVAYAKQTSAGDQNPSVGAGLGVIDVYDSTGSFASRLVSEGATLNAPSGMVLSPSGFGDFSNALLVANAGDGRINAYDPSNKGAFLGTLTDASGAPIAIPGLRGIVFGNGALNQPRATLFFAAGTNNGANGLYGRID